eukprot:269947_1
MVEFVKLNVGGHHYHISRVLIEAHPETMIARAVIAAEENYDPDDHSHDDTEVFIEGDGVAFRFVLNFLRYGRVFLPITETKASFMNELSYYDIKGNPDEVHTVGYMHTGVHATEHTDASNFKPCTCTGSCGDSCACKKSRRGCSSGCSCACADSDTVKPCTSTGSCGNSCECRKSRQGCSSGCSCACADSDTVKPCTSTGSCGNSCECRKSRQGCSSGCPCTCANTTNSIKPCNCTGASCKCRKCQQVCSPGCNCPC